MNRDVTIDRRGLQRTHFFPVQRHAAIERRHLINRAFANLPALILLRGPGGIGKSVTAAQIGVTFTNHFDDAHAVWVRCDRNDVGAGPVWTRILSRMVHAGVLPADSLAGRLASGGVPSLDDVIHALHAQNRHLMVVLDDAHESINPEVESSVLDVLEHVALLTITVTSKKPLGLLDSPRAKLRVPVLSLTQRDLYLSRAEVRELVQLRLDDESPTDAVAHSVFEQTKGWPLAVHGSLVEHTSSDPSDHLSLDAKPRRVFLTDIVGRLIRTSNMHTRHILCLVAHYGEASAPMLSAALDVPESSCQAYLEYAHEDALDYWVDDEGTRWYHLHELVAAELRRLTPELVSAREWKQMAARLARVTQSNRPQITMQAAIVAQDWELLSDLLTQGTALTLSRSERPVSLRHVPEQVKREYPIIAAFSLIHEYAFPSGVFGKALTEFRTLTSRTLRMQARQPGFPGLTAAVLKMIISRITGNEHVTTEMADLATENMRSLSDEDQSKHSWPLQVAANLTAITYLHIGRFHDAMDLLEPMRTWRESLQPKCRAHAASLSAWAATMIGDTRLARVFLSECESLDVPVNWRNSYIGAGYRFASAIAALERSDVDAAQSHVDAMRDHEATIEHWPYLVYVQALITETTVGPAAARKYLDAQRSRKGTRSVTTKFMKHMLDALHARLSWQTGRVLSNRMNPQSFDGVYRALSRNETALAQTRAAELSDSPDILENTRSCAEVALIRAVIAVRQKDLDRAAVHASYAVTLMTDAGITLPMRVVPRDISRVLARLVPNLPVAYASKVDVSTITPLTPSEQRALTAVVVYGSVPKAAQAVFLSPNTVKGYLKQVYRKLGVSSREEAVRVATEAGLLTEEHDVTKNL